MMEKMPERAFDVGIAEQHAVTFAAGLASQGMIPFCNIYSSFMQRSYDQAIHDVALQKLNVVFCLDRGGLVGADGATHHGAFDLAYMRIIPNLTISAPMDESELRNLMYTAQLENKGPFVIRYPRGKGVLSEWKTDLKEIHVGKGRIIREGNDIAILTIGTVGNFIHEIEERLLSKEISFAHYDMRFIKPLDEELLHSVFQKYSKIITVEDGVVTGGFGSAVLEFMNLNAYNAGIIRLGIPDRFIGNGTQQQLHDECGYSPDRIFDCIIETLKLKTDNS
jgi:1-deoxy-D-xylulose-5-phosphate synthase